MVQPCPSNSLSWKLNQTDWSHIDITAAVPVGITQSNACIRSSYRCNLEWLKWCVCACDLIFGLYVYSDKELMCIFGKHVDDHSYRRYTSITITDSLWDVFDIKYCRYSLASLFTSVLFWFFNRSLVTTIE